MSRRILVPALTEEAARQVVALAADLTAQNEFELYTVFKIQTPKPIRVRNLEGLDTRLTQLRNMAFAWERASDPDWRCPSGTLGLPCSDYFKNGFAALALSHAVANCKEPMTLAWFSSVTDLAANVNGATLAIECPDDSVSAAIKKATLLYLSGAAGGLATIEIADLVSLCMSATSPSAN